VLNRKPRDCTDSLLPQLAIDVQSPWYRVSHTMPNKTNNRRRVKVKPRSQPKQQPPKPTPFADAGGIVGTKLGAMFNAPYLKGVGKWLGSGIGQIFGSGNYQLMGDQPTYNVLANGAQIPKFSTTHQTNIVCHREYLGDINGTAGFTNRQFPLNPGMANTFPWLSTIAQNYQEYKFHGIIFEFRPLITDFVAAGAPGAVIMATNYNSDSPAYTSKQEMENSEFAVSVKPTLGLMHGVECNGGQTILPQRYVRIGNPPVGQDLRLYDLGLFQFATQTNPVQALGELWVSYCVEFFKPVLPLDVGGVILSHYSNRGTVAPATPLGNLGGISSGNLTVTFTAGTTASWFANPGDNYLINFLWKGSGAVACNPPNVTPTDCSLLVLYTNRASGLSIAPDAGVVSSSSELAFVVTCTALNPGLISFTLSNTGTYPTGSIVTVMITEYSSTAV